MISGSDSTTPSRSTLDRKAARTGVAYGLSAYLLWGFFPLFFKQLTDVPPLQVLAHRITWSLFTLAAILAFVGVGKAVWNAVRDIKVVLILCCTTVLIATNWFVFISAVSWNEVLQSSLGYFINPLVSVLLGFLFLRERLNRLQTVSVAAAGFGVLILTVQHGRIPWIALILALTFGLYGLLRKVVKVDALTGLFIETLLLFPGAVAYLLFLSSKGEGAFFAGSPATSVYLVLSGIITAVPLLWFAISARLLPLSTVGFMQYLTPTMHFLLAVLVFREPFDRVHLVSFLCIWAGLALYTYDTVHALAKGAVRGV